MKKIRLVIALLVFTLFFLSAKPSHAETILFEDFEDTSGFTIGGGPVWGYWDIAPLVGTTSIPSNLTTGGSQSGNIFFGSFAKYGGTAPSPTVTVNVPDLTGYENVHLKVSLAAPDCTVSTCWEITHRDKLAIDSNLGQIDIFLPVSNASALHSLETSRDLHYDFQDHDYSIDTGVTSITFTFASTAYDEVVGIDSLEIVGDPISLQPTDKGQCRNGGWKVFTDPAFKNQGACVRYVIESNRPTRPARPPRPTRPPRST